MNTNTAEQSSIINTLKAIAPCLAVTVSASHDPNYTWDGDGPDPVAEGFLPYDITVAVSAIQQGKLITGEDYLGGHYKRPSEDCGDVSGYLPQMVEEAIHQLDRAVVDRGLSDAIAKASKAVREHMLAAYEAQQQQPA